MKMNIEQANLVPVSVLSTEAEEAKDTSLLAVFNQLMTE